MKSYTARLEKAAINGKNLMRPLKKHRPLTGKNLKITRMAISALLWVLRELFDGS
jgi:hypothetical protein